jgi:hypothetical protein
MTRRECGPCRNGDHLTCDSTTYANGVATYCHCWADGHPDDFTEPAEREITDADARANAYEAQFGWGDS